MPYLPSEARKKSELYNNLLNGDVQEYQDYIEDLHKKINISGSVVDSKQPLRESDGTLVSFESSVDGVALEEEHQQVRLENKQQFFIGEFDSDFEYFFQPKDTEVGDDVVDIENDSTTIEFQMNNRDYLIQFINEYFGEENTTEISTDKLHNKIIQFFSENKKDKKNVNAEGWEDFRLNRKRNVRGISGKRFKEVKKDLKNFRYDEVVEDHLYRTLQGQQIWLRLGFPYIVDKNIKS
tara:strand:+ start:26 stop:736 length:711 start_codon:yes stop_codon:yes gene_type:complete